MIGLRCVDPDPEKRPAALDIIEMLDTILGGARHGGRVPCAFEISSAGSPPCHGEVIIMSHTCTVMYIAVASLLYHREPSFD